MWKTYVESAAAARKLGKRAVLLIRDDPSNLPSGPKAQDVIAIPYAPYGQLFPHASVLVHQGGIGTTGNALCAGKPILVVPYGGDQFDNGARVERLGVGRILRRDRYRTDRMASSLAIRCIRRTQL